MRLIDIVFTAIANSFRSRLRTVLTVLALFIGAFSLTLTNATGTGVSNYIDTQVASIGADDVLTIVRADPGTANGGPAKYDPDTPVVSGGGGSPVALFIQPLSEADIEVIRDTDGILDVDPAVEIAPTYIQYGSGGQFQMTVNPTAALARADLAAGHQLEDEKENQLLLPASYVDSMGFDDAADAVGKTVTIGVLDYLGNEREVEGEIVGVANQTLLSSGVGLNQWLTGNINLIESAGRPDNLSESYAAAAAFISETATPEEVEAITASLAEDGLTAQTVADQIGAFQTVITVIIGILNAFAAIALIAAGLGIVNTLLMSVKERTREIGLMKAMGMGGFKIFLLFSVEAVFIGFLGSAIGAGVAIGLGTVLSTLLARRVLGGLPGLQVLVFDPISIAVIILVVMVIAFLAGTLPAIRAARQNPIDALRYE